MEANRSVPFLLSDYCQPRMKPTRYRGMARGQILAPQERWVRRRLVELCGRRQAKKFIMHARKVHKGEA